MALSNTTMTYDQLGKLTAHLLHKVFIESSRTVAKSVYRRLIAGEFVPITHLEFEREERLTIHMKLDTLAYRGDINYSRFKDGVTVLLHELVTVVSEEGKLRTFAPREDSSGTAGTRLLGVSGSTQHGEDINVLMVAMTPSQSEPKILVELMYMDPDQFASAKRGES